MESEVVALDAERFRQVTESYVVAGRPEGVTFLFSDHGRGHQRIAAAEIVRWTTWVFLS
ncbi:hypothetical protein [Streptomyces sp. NPDC003952]